MAATMCCNQLRTSGRTEAARTAIASSALNSCRNEAGGRCQFTFLEQHHVAQSDSHRVRKQIAFCAAALLSATSAPMSGCSVWFLSPSIPDEKDLPFVCDLEFAPRNPDGLVEFKAVLDIVKPVDLSHGNGKLLFDFSNRGGRGAFTRLNDGGGDYSKAERGRQRFSQSPRLHGGHRGLARRSGLYRQQRRRLFAGGAPERPAAAR